MAARTQQSGDEFAAQISAMSKSQLYDLMCQVKVGFYPPPLLSLLGFSEEFLFYTRKISKVVVYYKTLPQFDEQSVQSVPSSKIILFRECDRDEGVNLELFG